VFFVLCRLISQLDALDFSFSFCVLDWIWGQMKILLFSLALLHEFELPSNMEMCFFIWGTVKATVSHLTHAATPFKSWKLAKRKARTTGPWQNFPSRTVLLIAGLWCAVCRGLIHISEKTGSVKRRGSERTQISFHFKDVHTSQTVSLPNVPFIILCCILYYIYIIVSH